MSGFFVPVVAHAAAVGPQSPTTGANDSAIGTISWSNPGRVVSSNNSRSEADLNDFEISNYLKASGFDFSAIPSDATIYGIEVTVERQAETADRIEDNELRLFSTSVGTSTDNKADTATSWGGSPDATVTYGGSSDLWGNAWTPADIQSASFAVLFAAKKDTDIGSLTEARVDHITVKVFYSHPPSMDLTSPVGGEFWSGIHNIAWTTTDADGGLETRTVDLEYTSDGGANWTTIVSDTADDGSYFWDTAPIPDGTTYQVRATVDDGFATSSETSGLVTLTTLDNTSPISTASSVAATNATPTNVDFTATDAISPAVDLSTRLWYRFDAGTWTNTGQIQSGGSGTFSFNFTNGEGIYDFYTRARDEAGNQEASPVGDVAKSTTVYDITPPDIDSLTAVATTNTGNPAVLGIGDVLTFTLVFGTTPEPGVTINNASSYNGQPLVWTTGDGGITYTATYTVTSGDTDQPVPVNLSGVTATDPAGNTSSPAVDAVVAESIDANAPTVVSVDSDGAVYNLLTSSPQTIKATFSEIIAIAPSISVSGDGAQTVNDCSDGDAKTFCFDYVIPTIDNTTKTISIASATDPAGNTMTPDPDATHTFVVDTVAPAAPSTPDLDVTSDSGISSTDDITNDNTPLIVGTAEVGATVTLYEGLTMLGTDIADGAGNWGITSAPLSDGVHTLTAIATDPAGNSSPTSGSLPITIDTELVQLTLTSTAPNPTNTQPIPFEVEFTEPVFGFDTALTDISVTGGGSATDPAMVDPDSYTFTVSPTGADPLDVDLLVQVVAGAATDIAGNPNVVSSAVPITYDTMPPTVLSIALSDADALVKQGDSLTFTVTFDEDMDLLPVPTIELSGTETLAGAAMTRVSATEYEYVHTVGAGDGDVTVSIAAGEDLATNPMTPYTEIDKYTVDNTKPVIDPHGDENVVANANGGATVTYSLPAATDLHPANPAVICLPASGDFFPLGTTPVLCDATDEAGNAADQTTFDVIVVPDTIVKVTVEGTSPHTTAETSTLTINGRDQYDNITTNQSGQAILVSVDNGGALDSSLVTLVSGAATASLTKTTPGLVHVTVTGTGPDALLVAGADTVTFISADTTGPTVTSFFPIQNATGVSVTTPIFVIFDETLAAGTVNSGNLSLHKASDSSAVPATVSLVEGGMQANITPNAALEFDTAYYIEVSAGVTDLAGNALTTPLGSGNTGFTTAPDTSDTVAPQTVGMSPADDSTDASLDISPIIIFDEALDPTTVSSASVELRKYSDDSAVSGLVSLIEGGTQVVINPDAALDYLTQYYLAVTTDVKDLAGNSLATAWDSANKDDHEFTTEAPPADTNGPAISDIQVSGIGTDSATITWTTDEPSDSIVEYGLTSSYGNMTPVDLTMTTSHSVTLSGLADSTDYHFRAVSADGDANSSTSGDNTFTTTLDDTAELAITGIDTVQSFATANGVFEDGWKFTFHITVPTAETTLHMKFDDFSGTGGTIPAANNIRFYSTQSSNAFDTGSAIVIAGANAYSSDMTLASDLAPGAAGRQIDVTVEVAVPSGTASGSYSTSYGVESL